MADNQNQHPRFPNQPHILDSTGTLAAATCRSIFSHLPTDPPWIRYKWGKVDSTLRPIQSGSKPAKTSLTLS